jgi:hypothetical protein
MLSPPRDDFADHRSARACARLARGRNFRLSRAHLSCRVGGIRARQNLPRLHSLPTSRSVSDYTVAPGADYS